jgi:hypothetical protein
LERLQPVRRAPAGLELQRVPRQGLANSSGAGVRLQEAPGVRREGGGAAEAVSTSRESAAQWIESMVGMAFRSGWQWRATEEDAERWRQGEGQSRR